MERTQAFIVGTGATEGDKITHHVNNICCCEDSINGCTINHKDKAVKIKANLHLFRACCKTGASKCSIFADKLNIQICIVPLFSFFAWHRGL